MRIAWITYDFEEYSTLHASALAEQHEVLLVMPQAEPGDKQHTAGDRVQHFLFDKPRLRQPWKQWLSIRKIVERVKAYKPDVIHFQQGHLWFNAALRWLREYPLVITIHDPRHHAGDEDSKRTPQWVMDYGFRKADHVIVHGQALKSQVLDLFGFPPENIHVIPHVVMGDDIKPTSQGEIAEDPNLVLFFGRIWAYKGLDQLIAAQPLINEHCPDARILIAGRGDDFSIYSRLMVDPHRFDVENRWISDDERAEMFKRSAVVVLPYNEATQSGVVPVAFNYGKPVVATNVGALGECVRDGIDGLLVEPRDPKALANAIVKILQDEDLRARLGQAGKRVVNRDWSPRSVAKQHIDVYEKTLGIATRSDEPHSAMTTRQPVEMLEAK